MKKLIIVIFIISGFCGFAQEDDSHEGFDPSNLFTGGSVSFGLGFGSYNKTFLAGINPHFGYTIAKWIDAGIAVNFQYYTAKDIYNYKYRSTTYGPAIFTRIYPVRFLFIQVQPEYNFIKQKFILLDGNTLQDNLHAKSLLLGAGYTTSRSDKNSFTYLSILFDVLKDPYSPYIDGYGRIIPVVRAGINIGLNKKRTRL
jgi:hypothetical protein